MAILSVWLVLIGANGFETGIAAFREGRYDAALEAFSQAEQEAGDEASAALLFNRSLAALRAGVVRNAEASIEKAVVRGGLERFGAARDFLYGNAAFVRCLRSEAEASLPEAPPFAYDLAIQEGEAAVAAWKQAVMKRPGWPAARRNVERALRKVEELRAKKAAAPEPPKKKDPPKPPEPPEPPPDAEVKSQKEVKVQAQMKELTAEQLGGLLEKLGQKEREKRAVRREERKSSRVRVERDW